MTRPTRLALALGSLLLLPPDPAGALLLRFAGDVTVVKNVTAEANSLGPPDAAASGMFGPSFEVPGEMILSEFGEGVVYDTAALAALLGVSEPLLLGVDAIAVEVGRVPNLTVLESYETSTHGFADGSGSREVANVYLGAFGPEIVARPVLQARTYDPFFGTTTPPPTDGIIVYAFLLFDFDAAPGDAIDVLAPNFTWRIVGDDLSVGSPDPEFFAVVAPIPEPASGVLALFGLCGLAALGRGRVG